MSPRPPPKISFRHDWTRGEVPLGSTVDQQPEGKVVRQPRGEVSQQAKFSQLTQPIPKPICDRSGQLDNTQGVFVVKGETSRSHDIKVKSFHEELCSSDRSGQPDKHNVALQDAPEVHRGGHGLQNSRTTTFYCEAINCRVPAFEKLIQKIENHPNRHALQRDLQQSQSFNPFSQESKQMIHEVGNIELCELLDMEPKAQCKVCLSYWDVGIVYCTCRHFMRQGTEKNKKFVQYTMDLLSIPNYYIKKGRPHGHRYWKKPGDREYYIANSLKKKCKITWVSTTESYETKSSART